RPCRLQKAATGRDPRQGGARV
ncbi:MAG: hypothetical protein, partial [Olavius algarvensis Gamma 1 endosymbiont]